MAVIKEEEDIAVEEPTRPHIKRKTRYSKTPVINSSSESEEEEERNIIDTIENMRRNKFR